MMTSFEGFDTLASSNLPRPEQLAQGVITKINDKKDSFFFWRMMKVLLY